MPGHHFESRLEGEHPYGDLGQLILLVAFLIVWIADSFFLKWTTFLASIIPLWLRLSVAVLIFGLAVYCAKKSHDLIFGGEHLPDYVLDKGIYGKLRHPMYFGALMLYKGMVVATLSLASAALFIFIFLFYNFIAAYEERTLTKKYGSAYEAYKNRVPRWIL
jgi:protein-S-isoprenylcysteine O-methyltransferase Ste14